MGKPSDILNVIRKIDKYYSPIYLKTLSSKDLIIQIQPGENVDVFNELFYFAEKRNWDKVIVGRVFKINIQQFILLLRLEEFSKMDFTLRDVNIYTTNDNQREIIIDYAPKRGKSGWFYLRYKIIDIEIMPFLKGLAFERFKLKI